MAVGHEAVVADAMKPVGQRMDQEAADELIGIEGHDLRAAAVAIILPAECDMVVGYTDQAGVGDRNPMGVAPEIGQNLLGPAERRFGVDDPFDPAQVIEMLGEGRAVRQAGKCAEEAEPSGCEGRVEFGQEQPAEESREYTHRQEEAGTAGDPARTVERRTAAGHDAMDMRVMVEILAPGVEHGDETGFSPQMPRIGGDRLQCLGRRPEQDGVDCLLVLERDLGNRRGHGEHDVEIRHRQQLGLPCSEPLCPRGSLALRAMAVAAGIIGAAHEAAVGAR